MRKIQVGNESYNIVKKLENTYIVERDGESTLQLIGEWITKNE